MEQGYPLSCDPDSTGQTDACVLSDMVVQSEDNKDLLYKLILRYYNDIKILYMHQFLHCKHLINFD